MTCDHHQQRQARQNSISNKQVPFYGIMHSSLLLFPAASASAAAVEPRQVDGEVYCCGGKSGFNPDDCRAAAERIPTDRTHGVAAEAWYGNCSP